MTKTERFLQRMYHEVRDVRMTAAACIVFAVIFGLSVGTVFYQDAKLPLGVRMGVMVVTGLALCMFLACLHRLIKGIEQAILCIDLEPQEDQAAPCK